MKIPGKKLDIAEYDAQVVASEPEANRVEICRKALRILFPSAEQFGGVSRTTSLNAQEGDPLERAWLALHDE